MADARTLGNTWLTLLVHSSLMMPSIEYHQIQVTITNNVFNNNSSGDNGGAIYCVGGSGSGFDAIIKDNVIIDDATLECDC